nr:MAG TPA: stabilization protein [Caudoviricetes sp.]
MEVTRFALNGGEQSPYIAVRVELEAHTRGCRSVLNMELLQTGGAKRRRGMRHVSNLDKIPLGMSSATLSDGANVLLLVYDDAVEIRATDGTVIFSGAYDARGGAPRFYPINDTIYLLNERVMPHVMKRTGGVWNLGEIVLRTVPTTEGYKQDFPLKLSNGLNAFRVCDAWDSMVEEDGVMVAGTFQGHEFRLGEFLCVKDTIPATVNNLRFPWSVVESKLKSTKYTAGQFVFYKSNSINYFYECIKEWKPEYATGTSSNPSPSEYPDFFRAGLDVSGMFWSAGGWKLYRGQSSIDAELVVQESSDDGVTWSNRLVFNPSVESRSSNVTVTGDNDGDLLLMRVALRYLQDSTTISSFLSIEARFTIEAYTAVFDYEITRIYSSGYFLTQNNSSSVTYPYRTLSSRVTDRWELQAWSRSKGYPSCMALHESRLVFGGVMARPQTLWFSGSDDLEDYRAGTNDDKPIVITLSTRSQSTVRWMESQQRKLYVGTDDAEWVVSGTANGKGVITPTEKVAEPHSAIGSSSLPSLMLSSSVLYTEEGNQRMRQFAYNYERDGYVSTDLTVYAEHVLKGRAVAMAARKRPQIELFVVLADGTGAAMTYNDEHHVNAWSRIETDGALRGVAVTKDDEGRGDLCWWVVERQGVCSLEVQQDGNPFTDGLNGTPYISELITNSLDSSETLGTRRHNATVVVYFIAGDGRSLLVSNDGVSWVVPSAEARHAGLNGWVNMTASATWDDGFCVGVRVTDDTDLHLAGVKAIFT